ncbi:MAG: hypothetical protein EHM60_05830 [Lysobacterales bacterium]|nr:MAG: hypothetical protein EHM60_05830 [Xanthomonadales bacterium]
MSEKVKKPLIAACRHLLHPLVRILIRHGVSYGEFSDAVRGAFIDIASVDLIPVGRPHSDSRLSILTGIKKEEIRRIRAQDANDDSEVGLNRIARVLQAWSQDPEYLGPYGLPLEIPLYGDTISFEHLVKTYADGVTPRALLDELLRVNAALETDDGYVRLLNRTYLPSPLDPVGLERLGNVVSYFIDTVDFNLQKKKQGEGRFERYAITMEGLSANGFQAFDALIREKGQELLEILDDWLGENEIKGGHRLPPNESIRTGVGIFHFVEKDPTIPDENEILVQIAKRSGTYEFKDEGERQ